MKSVFIQDLAVGSSIESVFALESGELLPFRRKPGRYLKLFLSDRTGTISATLWDNAEDTFKRIADSNFVKIIGKALTYKNELTINIDSIEPVDTDDVDLDDFLPSALKDIGKMLLYLKSVINSIKEPHLKELLDLFWDDDEFLKDFAKAPAAKKYHQPYLGGLLEHTTNILHLVSAVCSNYPEADRDLLNTGVILHDIGKIKEYQYDTSIDMADEGRFLGHIILSIQMIDEKISEIDDFPEELRLKLMHMIASHHGHYEWQSPKIPKYLEACLLHHMDLLDGEAFKFTNVDKDSTGNWTCGHGQKHWADWFIRRLSRMRKKQRRMTLFHCLHIRNIYLYKCEIGGDR